MIRLATRRSPLALRQAHIAAARIERATGARVEILPLSSLGDEDQVRPLARFLEPGAFTGRLDQALQNGEADLAVHSLKDVPLRSPKGISRTYVLERADPADRLVLAKGVDLSALAGKRIGTSAPRRRSQLEAHEQEAIAVDVRGSIGTRLKRLSDGELDALFVAAAALDRGDETLPAEHAALRLPLGTWPTAPGQGALALQAPEGSEAEKVLKKAEDAAAARAVAAERGLLADLGGGCGTPLGATCLPPGHPEGHTKDWTLHVTYPRDDHTTLLRLTLHDPDPTQCRSRALRALQHPDPTKATSPEPTPEQRVLLVMDAETSPLWQRRLRAQGCDAIYWWPFQTTDLIADEATRRRAREAYADTDWVLVTSVRAVSACSKLHQETDVLPRFAVIGPATARAMQAATLPVTLVPPTAQGVDLARLLARRAAAEGTHKVFWPSGRNVTASTEHALQAADLQVTRVPVYDVRPANVPPPPEGPFDAILLASARTARHALDLLGPAPDTQRILAIGPTTATALSDVGVQATPLPSPTPDALLRLIRSR